MALSITTLAGSIRQIRTGLVGPLSSRAAFTVEGKVNLTTHPATGKAIVSPQAGVVDLLKSASGTDTYAWTIVTLSGTITLEGDIPDDGEWHTVTLDYDSTRSDGKRWVMQVDGVETSSNNTNSNTVAGTGRIVLGITTSIADLSLYEVAAWDFAFSTSQRTEINSGNAADVTLGGGQNLLYRFTMDSETTGSPTNGDTNLSRQAGTFATGDMTTVASGGSWAWDTDAPSYGPSISGLAVSGNRTTRAAAGEPGTGEVGIVFTPSDDGTAPWVVTTSATAPSTAQILAGLDHTGAAAVVSGNETTAAGVEEGVSLTGLAPSTAYYFHVYHNDGSLSTDVSTQSFTTKDVIYVAPGGSGDGSAPNNAYGDFGTAYDNAASGDMIDVLSDGTSVPTLADAPYRGSYTKSGLDDLTVVFREGACLAGRQAPLTAGDLTDLGGGRWSWAQASEPADVAFGYQRDTLTGTTTGVDFTTGPLARAIRHGRAIGAPWWTASKDADMLPLWFGFLARGTGTPSTPAEGEWDWDSGTAYAYPAGGPYTAAEVAALLSVSLNGDAINIAGDNLRMYHEGYSPHYLWWCNPDSNNGYAIQIAGGDTHLVEGAFAAHTAWHSFGAAVANPVRTTLRRLHSVGIDRSRRAGNFTNHYVVFNQGTASTLATFNSVGEQLVSIPCPKLDQNGKPLTLGYNPTMAYNHTGEATATMTGMNWRQLAQFDPSALLAAAHSVTMSQGGNIATLDAANLDATGFDAADASTYGITCRVAVAYGPSAVPPINMGFYDVQCFRGGSGRNDTDATYGQNVAIQLSSTSVNLCGERSYLETGKNRWGYTYTGNSSVNTMSLTDVAIRVTDAFQAAGRPIFAGPFTGTAAWITLVRLSAGSVVAAQDALFTDSGIYAGTLDIFDTITTLRVGLGLDDLIRQSNTGLSRDLAYVTDPGNAAYLGGDFADSVALEDDAPSLIDLVATKYTGTELIISFNPDTTSGKVYQFKAGTSITDAPVFSDTADVSVSSTTGQASVPCNADGWVWCRTVVSDVAQPWVAIAGAEYASLFDTSGGALTRSRRSILPGLPRI